MVETFGQYLKRIREELGYSTRKVKMVTARYPEKEQHVSDSYLSLLERGKVKKPSPGKLFGLARVYGVPYEDLMKRVHYLTGRTEDLAVRLPNNLRLLSPRMRSYLARIAELPQEDQDIIASVVEPLILREEEELKRKRERRRRNKQGSSDERRDSGA